MASDYEITGSIVEEVVKARGQAISGINYVAGQTQLIKDLLSDEAVVDLYKKVMQVVSDPSK